MTKGVTELDSFDESNPRDNSRVDRESLTVTTQASGSRRPNEDISPLETSAATNPLTSVGKEGGSGRKNFDFNKVLEAETKTRTASVLCSS